MKHLKTPVSEDSKYAGWDEVVEMDGREWVLLKDAKSQINFLRFLSAMNAVTTIVACLFALGILK